MSCATEVRHNARGAARLRRRGVVLLALLPGVLGAEVIHAESLGPLRTGLGAAEVERRLGLPMAIEAQPTECPGQPPATVWDYPDRGLVVVMAGQGAGARLLSASSYGSNPFATERGIRIGASHAEVAAAYPDAAADPPLFRVEEGDHRLEIRFSADEPPRVAGILLTAEPTLVYDEDGGCPTEEEAD